MTTQMKSTRLGSEKGRFYTIDNNGQVVVVEQIELSGKTVTGRNNYICGECGYLIGRGEAHWASSSGKERRHPTCPKPMRDIDIDDCRALGMYPSRTEISQVYDRSGLTSRRNILIANHASEHPRQTNASQPGFEDEDSYGVRIVEEAVAHWTFARDRGTELHAACWRFLHEGQWPDREDEVAVKACRSLAGWLKEQYPNLKLPNMTDLRTETAGIALDIGYGLTIDWLLHYEDKLHLADLKTINDLDKFEWGEFDPVVGRWTGGNYHLKGWAAQIGGYDQPLSIGRETKLNGIPDDWRKLPRQWYQFVVSRKTGDLRVFQWTPAEVAWGWRYTDLARQSWMMANSYIPPTVKGEVAGVPTEAEMEAQYQWHLKEMAKEQK